jgi:hypothetical protein
MLAPSFHKNLSTASKLGGENTHRYDDKTGLCKDCDDLGVAV